MTFLKKIIFAPLNAALVFFVNFGTVFANGLDNPLNFDSISSLLAGILDVVAQIALPLVVLAIIYTGFLFVKAQGNEEELAKAKTALFWTIIGAIVLLGASVLVDAIQGTVESIRTGFITEIFIG